MHKITLGAFIVWSGKDPLLATAHVATGALILGVTILSMLRAQRFISEGASASVLSASSTIPFGKGVPMKANAEALNPAIARDRSRYADYWILTKPELSMLSVLTTFSGFYLAHRGMLNVPLLIATIAGTGLLAAGAASMNMYFEREHDALMRRTQKRPIPSGRILPVEALLFGITCGVTGAIVLAVGVDLLTAALGAATYVSYIFIYTPLKRRSTINTLVGCIPGAIPPMMGWTAARGTLGIEALALFAILFVWQMPHFLSLAWMYRADYKRAGFKMTPVNDTHGVRTSAQILIFCAALIPAGMAPSYLGLAGSVYLYSAIGLGSAFFAMCIVLAVRRTNTVAKQVFAASLLYLPALFSHDV